MSPNLEDQMPDSPDVDSNEHVHLNLTPLSDLSISTSLSEGNLSDSESYQEASESYEVLVVDDQRNHIPLEQNLRALLVKVANTDNLESVTHIKLRVIARELALQQMGFFLPALRELSLDGSIVSSLRDLGTGLKNLKILKVSRCQLVCIDAVLGFEALEELHAADNSIKDLSPCAFLTNLKLLDVRRNSIKHFGSLSFLNLCPNLSNLFLDGNDVINELCYKQTVKRLLPNLQILDDITLENATPDPEISLDVDFSFNDVEEEGLSDETTAESSIFTSSATHLNSSRLHPVTSQALNGFSVRFPPRVFSEKSNASDGKYS